MPGPTMKTRVLVCLVVSALLIVGSMSFAFADTKLPVPGTDIDLGDLLPLGDKGIPGVVEDLTDILNPSNSPLRDIPVVPQVTGTVTELVSKVQEYLPLDSIPVVNSVLPALTGVTTQGAPAAVTGSREITGAFSSMPGTDALGNLSPDSLPGLDQLTGLFDPANLEDLPLIGTLLGILDPANLENLPLIGTLLGILDPAQLPTLDDIPVISSVIPIVTGLLKKVKEIPVVGPILKPIVEIIEKIIAILLPRAPEEPEEPVIPTLPTTPTVPQLTVPVTEAPVSGSPGGTLPFTGADFTGIMFLIAALLGSTLLVRKLEVSLKKARARSA